jgi:serine/threonine protein kinase
MSCNATHEPATGATSDSARQERLNEVLLACAEALQDGAPLDRQALRAAHEDLRDDLEAFFAGHDEVERLAAPFRAAANEAIKEEAIEEYVRIDFVGPTGVLPGGSQPALSAPADVGAGDPPGVGAAIGQLGDFRLLREIGRGGMGVVYEAEQISLERRVALKMLPFAAAIDPRQLQRFKNEALAAAQLRHENIVPVHAVGCERGVHYYAMQFIEGQSLAGLIAELRRLDIEGSAAGQARNGRMMRDGMPRDGMTIDGMTNHEPQGSLVNSIVSQSSVAPPHSLRAEPSAETVAAEAIDTRAGDAASLVAASISRQWSSSRRAYFDWVARLGRQAALALGHAHQMGIVHRDVKPGNLLLDVRGQVWITDFGLAQVIGEAGLTVSGELLGTLRYASPEQVRAGRGIVDHRADVYSLGATLYELVTLRPLLEGRDRHELLRKIADVEPPPPRSVVSALPSELETIILKALRKEPADRYATAQELADDLQRFLDNHPIRARRPTLAERARKWGRRHPSVIAATMLLVALLSAGSLASAALIRDEQARTRDEQRKVEAAYERERQRAEEAEARFQLARSSVDELVQVSEEELVHRPGMEGLRRRLLSSALAYYEQLAEQRRDEPSGQADLQDATRRVEKILADLAVLRAASQLYLLGQPTVLDDLGLDGGQRAKVRELSARVGRQWVESFRDIGRLSPAQRGRRALKQARANEAALNELLTPSQQARLREIKLQWELPGSFREPEVVEALQLTTEQRERIRAIEEEVHFARMRNNWPGSARKDYASDGKDKSAGDRILAVLSQEQLCEWMVMTGAPLKNPFGSPFAPATTQRDPKVAPREPAAPRDGAGLGGLRGEPQK